MQKPNKRIFCQASMFLVSTENKKAENVSFNSRRNIWPAKNIFMKNETKSTIGLILLIPYIVFCLLSRFMF